MHRSSHALRQDKRTLYPVPREQKAQAISLEELVAGLVVSPDDVPLETEDLAPHFLFEATQSAVPSSVPPLAAPIHAQGADAALREDFFEGAYDSERLREFERIWKHIISRELVSTEL